MSAHLCHQRTPECPYPLVLAHTPHTRDDTQTSQWCSPPDNWTNYRDWLLNNRFHFYEAPCLIILIPSMYLLRMTLHWTGVFTKSWLMVARAGSITIGIRNRNKENVQIPKKNIKLYKWAQFRGKIYQRMPPRRSHKTWVSVGMSVSSLFSLPRSQPLSNSHILFTVSN